ncbi:MAG: ACT domain-containing protein [Verrucomicrobiota bacterium]
MDTSNHSLVLTILGQDRPGLVESLASLVKDHQGNWEESRMCRLGGQFAGIVQITIPDTSLEAWKESIQFLQQSGLQILIAESSVASDNSKSQTAVFEIIGQDQPGIIQNISSALAKHEVNVNELSSECSSAPWSGGPLFKARAEVQIPSDCDISQLRNDLERIAAHLMIDIQFN